MSNPNPALLHELQQIVRCELSAIEHHPQQISDLREKIPHSIDPAPTDFIPSAPIDQYRCFQYALGLAERSDVSAIDLTFQNTRFDTKFIDYIVGCSLLVPIHSPPSNGDLVFYRDDQCFTHAGVFHADRIISKWGLGKVWLHGLHEVPPNYGAPAVRYKPVESQVVAGAFIRFAGERETTDTINDVINAGIG